VDIILSAADLAVVAQTAPTTGAGLADAIRNFVAPLFLLAISFAAMSFLFRRQITEFLQFAALGVGVAVFFYVPGIVEGLARVIAKALGSG
jgi:hypothetical protein